MRPQIGETLMPKTAARPSPFALPVNVEAQRAGPPLAEQRIKKVEAFPVSVKYAIPVSSAYGTRYFMDGVFLKITTDAGFVGFGEAGAAIPGYLGETQESILSAITKILAPQALLGQDPLRIGAVVQKMDALLLGNTQAKAIVDLALHDLAGRILGIPVYKLLGGGGSERNPIAWVVTASDLKQVTDDARRAAEAGFGHVDIKVGALSPDEDIRRVASIRDAVGKNVKLTVDANGSWTPDIATNTLEHMKKYDIYAVEQPTSDIMGLAEVRRRTGLTIIADESVRSLSDLRTVIETRAADVCGVKIARVGGLYKTRQMVNVAEAAGIPLEILSTVGTGLLCAAEATMLSSSGWFSRWIVGHKASNGLMFINGVFSTKEMDRSNDLIKGGVEIDHATVLTPSGVGLGVEVDEDLLMKNITAGFEPVAVS
jgi:L-alanine-DL-glutamate epimerase-like enolase superfamily enzyme